MPSISHSLKSDKSKIFRTPPLSFLAMETSPDSDSNVPDRHSMEMSVINGLKNLKDFQREITLLNIEKLSWVRQPQKVQRKKGPNFKF